MKCSYLCVFSTVGLTAYFITIMAKGAPEMAYHGSITGNATGFLDDANANFKEATKDYQTSLDNIKYAEQTIIDAKCFIDSYSSFNLELNNYYRPLNQTGNSLDKIRSYGLNIVRVSDEVERSIGYSSFTYSYQVDGTTTCTNPDKGKPICVTQKVTRYDTIQYQFPRTLYKYHGTQFQGSGSGIKMSCGKYSQSISITPNTITSVDTGWRTTISDWDYYYEVTKIIAQERITRDSSKVTINLEIDAKITPIVYNMDPGTGNFATASDEVVSLLMSQILNLYRNIAASSRYQNIIDTTTDTLQSLHLYAEQKQKILNSATAYKDEKQAIFDGLNADYQHSLSVWLPQLFVAFTILTCVCCILECANAEDNYQHVAHLDTDKKNCGIKTKCWLPCYAHQCTMNLPTRFSSSQPETTAPQMNESFPAATANTTQFTPHMISSLSSRTIALIQSAKPIAYAQKAFGRTSNSALPVAVEEELPVAEVIRSSGNQSALELV